MRIRVIRLVTAFITFILSFLYMQAGEIIIQENKIGFCSVDGSIMTSVEGYTGDGYADTDRGVGKSISWNVDAEIAVTCYLRWRYGNGGGSGDRPAKLLLNGIVAIDTVNFPHTLTWTNWTISDSVEVDLVAGSNNIRIEAYSADGLGNYDYMIINGESITPSVCIPLYKLNVGQNDQTAGTVSFEPIQEYYAEGTVITLRAESYQGYFFQSWSGDETSADSVFTFPIKRNTKVIAIFLTYGTKMDENLVGYASVQDDKGTPYLVTGGGLGDSVHVTSISELQTYLVNPDPYIVTFSKTFIGTETIKIKSNKTLLGIGNLAHLQGIELQVDEAQNVIIKNVIVSHVTPQDAIEINGASKNIWIDHCEFYSDKEHGTEYYDGLLDIKNESSFITVSWSHFHDHYKTILISSGDQQVADSLIRVTFHHNYFDNCESRLPSIRFGKAHIFNNYYKNCSTAINSRMGACVRIEKNFFNAVGTAVMMEYSQEKGNVELIDNYFGSSTYAQSPTCLLNIPYQYQHILDDEMDLPGLIAGDVVSIDQQRQLPRTYSLTSYPNPFNPITKITFTIPITSIVRLEIFNIMGSKVATLVNQRLFPGQYQIDFNGATLSSGLYLYRLSTIDQSIMKKMILLK
jgi:pectate lyase